jgi:hypothetical protein
MTLRYQLTCVDETDEELVAQLRAVMEQARSEPGETVFAVHGYDDDPRELGQIPEVMAHCRRTVDFGAIAVLTRSTWCRELGAAGWMVGSPILGAFEVWLIGLGHCTGDRVEMPAVAAKAMIDGFRREVLPAADRSLSRNLHRYAHVPAAGAELMLSYGD